MGLRSFLYGMLLCVCLVFVSSSGFADEARTRNIGRVSSPSSDYENERRIERNIRVDGRWRKYIAYLPDDFSAQKTYPALFGFHPGAASIDYMEERAPLHTEPAAQKYVTVYPQGYARTFNVGFCCGKAFQDGVDDIKFFKSIVQDLKQNVASIHPKIFATGFSNGSMMSYHLACKVPSMIAAIAPFAGTGEMKDCVPGYQIPTMSFCGEEDHGAMHGGERENKSRFSKVSDYLIPPYETLDKIAKANKCSLTSKSTKTISEIDATCQVYDECSGDHTVMHCVIPNLGHAWPGASEPSGFMGRALRERFGSSRPDLEGNKAVLQFFDAHNPYL